MQNKEEGQKEEEPDEEDASESSEEDEQDEDLKPLIQEEIAEGLVVTEQKYEVSPALEQQRIYPTEQPSLTPVE